MIGRTAGCLGGAIGSKVKGCGATSRLLSRLAGVAVLSLEQWPEGLSSNRRPALLIRLLELWQDWQRSRTEGTPPCQRLVIDRKLYQRLRTSRPLRGAGDDGILLPKEWLRIQVNVKSVMRRSVADSVSRQHPVENQNPGRIQARKQFR